MYEVLDLMLGTPQMPIFGVSFPRFFFYTYWGVDRACATACVWRSEDNFQLVGLPGVELRSYLVAGALTCYLISPPFRLF